MTELKGDGPAPILRPPPLSPHLTIWRWHITMTASILHRVSGVGLYFGALLLAGWVLSLSEGPDAYLAYVGILGSGLGKIVLFALTVCVFFHMANGVRHLAWDLGEGFEPRTADFTAVVVMAFALVASAVVWGLALLTGGI